MYCGRLPWLLGEGQHLPWLAIVVATTLNALSPKLCFPFSFSLSALEEKMDDAFEKKMGDAQTKFGHACFTLCPILEAQNMHNMFPKCVWAE